MAEPQTDQNQTNEEQLDEQTNKPDTPDILDDTAKARLERLEKLEELARSMEYESPEAYLQSLEEIVYSDELKKGRQTVTQPEPKKPEPQAAPQQGVPANDELMQRLQSTSVSAYLEAQWADAMVGRDREAVADMRKQKNDLLGYIQGPKRALVQELAQDPEYGGNLWLAAEGLKRLPTLLKDAEAKARAEAEAMAQAKESAGGPGGTGAPPPSKEDAQSQIADLIASDDPPFDYPGQ